MDSKKEGNNLPCPQQGPIKTNFGDCPITYSTAITLMFWKC